MYKNQLQELAQRSCFNLPSYTCIREGPDHAPRFKATVNFNGEIFESPSFCTTLRQAEHSAAEVALNSLSTRGPSHSLAARILDETGVYKNLLQEIAQRVGAALPVYTTFRCSLRRPPVFRCEVELAGITFTGEPAKSKKQAEKNAAMAAWSSLKQLAQQSGSSSDAETNDEQEQVTIARALLNYRLKEKMAMTTANMVNMPPLPKKFPVLDQKISQPSHVMGSKILPLICQKTPPRTRPPASLMSHDGPPLSIPSISSENRGSHLPNLHAAGAAPYVPLRQYQLPYHRMAPPVNVRTAVPVYSAPPLPPPPGQSTRLMAPATNVAPPVRIRPVVPAFAAPSPTARMDEPVLGAPPQNRAPVHIGLGDTRNAASVNDAQVSSIVQDLKKQLKI